MSESTSFQINSHPQIFSIVACNDAYLLVVSDREKLHP